MIYMFDFSVVNNANEVRGKHVGVQRYRPWEMGRHFRISIVKLLVFIAFDDVPSFVVSCHLIKRETLNNILSKHLPHHMERGSLL